MQLVSSRLLLSCFALKQVQHAAGKFAHAAAKQAV
jgi:hypothetical protein